MKVLLSLTDYKKPIPGTTVFVPAMAALKLLMVQMLLLVLGSLAAQSVHSAEKIRVETEYDMRGQVLRKSLPHKSGDTVRWTEFRYDSLDRQIHLTHPDGSSVTTRYLPGERFGAVETVDENGHKHGSHFDAFGNENYRDRYDQAQRLRTSFQYDVLGRLIDIRDPMGSLYWYAYDGHGNRVFDADPNLGCRQMAYDAGNRLKEQRSASGALVSYSYDALDRVTAKTADKDALQFSDCSFPITSGTRTETGGSGNDTLDAANGRLSDVTLSGGTGDDTYLIRARSGHVVIPSSAEGANGGSDTIRFVDLELANLKISKVANPQGGEFLQFSWEVFGGIGSLKVAQLGDHIERFEFADGSAIKQVALLADGRYQLWADLNSDGTSFVAGSSEDDYVYGTTAGNDVLDAGDGNGSWQRVQGYEGDDTYIYRKASGQLFISQREGESGGHDTVRFEDLTLSDITFATHQYTDANGLALRFIWNDGAQSGELRIANMGNHIERFEFADGSAIKQVALRADGRYQLWADLNSDGTSFVAGSSEDDYVYGTTAGNDVLDAGDGNGSWQHAQGYEGDDTYIYRKASGQLFISQREGESGGHDTVRFEDLTLSDIAFATHQYTDANGLALRFIWNDGVRSGELRIANMGNHIERYEFADGNVRTAGELQP